MSAAKPLYIAVCHDIHMSIDGYKDDEGHEPQLLRMDSWCASVPVGKHTLEWIKIGRNGQVHFWIGFLPFRPHVDIRLKFERVGGTEMHAITHLRSARYLVTSLSRYSRPSACSIVLQLNSSDPSSSLRLV
jgi:hypothetical protein